MTGETLNKIIHKLKLNYFPTRLDVKLDNIGILWLEHLKNDADDLVLEAIDIIIKQSKFFPNIAQIIEIIEESKEKKRYEMSIPKLQRPSYYEVTEKSRRVMRKALEAVKNNKTKEFFADIDISHIKNYIKDKFPDMTDSLIHRNYNELNSAAESAESCAACMWDIGDCVTSGYYLVPYLGKDGYIRLECTPCAKKNRRNKKA